MNRLLLLEDAPVRGGGGGKEEGSGRREGGEGREGGGSHIRFLYHRPRNASSVSAE